MKNTFAQVALNNPEVLTYVKSWYKLSEYSSERSEGNNAMGRILNNVIKAIQEKVLFPKAIVIIMDSDIFKNIDATGLEMTSILTTCVNHLTTKINEEIIKHKKSLPQRAKKPHYPTVLWIIPPEHDNFNDNCPREKLASLLQEEVKPYANMRYLRLLSWQSSDNMLVSRKEMSYRFSGRGLISYWRAVDQAIKTWDRFNNSNKSYNDGENFSQRGARQQRSNACFNKWFR